MTRNWLGFAASVLVLVVAVLYQQYIPSVKPQNSVYIIGDLHGDEYCARYWVNKTGLLGDGTKWLDPSSKLVFLGDYIDKGPTSKQTLEFVKNLTERFPQYVTALLGNHETELLLDRDSTFSSRWGKGQWFQLSYAATHPAEYLNYLDTITKEDHVVVDALYNASLEVYAENMHNDVFIMANDEAFLQYIPIKLQEIVKERLQVYQEAYLDAFRTGTPLGTWLEQRPIVALEGDTLLVHGGISPRAARLLKHEKGGIDFINEIFQKYSKQDQLNAFLEKTAEGQVIYEMLTYRGNHDPQACPYISSLLPEGASRLGVGHTPHYNIESKCNGRVLALDSSLGRHFRNSGNEYCLGEKQQTSSNGKFTCRKMNLKCQGEIVRIVNNEVQVIQA